MSDDMFFVFVILYLLIVGLIGGAAMWAWPKMEDARYDARLDRRQGTWKNDHHRGVSRMVYDHYRNAMTADERREQRVKARQAERTANRTANQQARVEAEGDRLMELRARWLQERGAESRDLRSRT